MCSVLADKDIWGDSEVFRPERFLDEHGRIVRHEAFIPFMIGNYVFTSTRIYGYHSTNAV